MPTPHTSENFGDLLDPRFQRIFYEKYDELPDMLPQLFNSVESDRNEVKWSNVGAAGDWSQFTGNVTYDSLAQGYDSTQTHVEFASGLQVERKLFDDDQFNIMDRRPRALAIAANRTRQKHGARVLNNGFSVDNFFYSNSEAVSLFNDSHTTTADGVSTASGFDNKGTSALSAVAVTAARIGMVNQRDDRANRISVTPDEIWIPPDLYEIAFEIVQSMGKVDTANNNRNVHEGQYTIVEWNYLTDANNWFMFDQSMRSENLYWADRIPMEFAMAEDIDTLNAKWRGYMRYSNVWVDWRGTFGAEVS